MEIRTLYRINNSGKVTVTPNKPSHNDYTETFRLIADAGMILTDGKNTCTCIDTDEPSKYSEIADTNFTEVTELDYQNALAEMGVDLHE